MINESQYSNSVQRYGKNKVSATLKLVPSYLADNFLFKICEFYYCNHEPLDEIVKLFTKIYALNINVGNLNRLSYDELRRIVDNYKFDGDTLMPNPYFISKDGMVEIYKVNSYEEVLDLSFKNSWCIKDISNYNYHNFEKSTSMYLIVNKYFTNRENMRYVMAEVYPKNQFEDEHIVYWATNNEELSGTKLQNYLSCLEGGERYIQLIPVEDENQYQDKQNETRMRNKWLSSINEWNDRLCRIDKDNRRPLI